MSSARRYFLQGDDNQIKNVITSVTLLRDFAYHACFKCKLSKANLPVEAFDPIDSLKADEND